jgi:hypothetical protein
MARTGERYAAARRVLLDQATRPGGRVWVSQPEVNDDSIRQATGRDWDEWCDLIDAWPGNRDGHTAIAKYVHEELGVGGWWGQGVTVGYERITGLRLPHQMSDGTFTASKSRTVDIDAGAIRELLLGDGREDLFPGYDTQMRSKPSAKVLKIIIGPGIAAFYLDAAKDGRTKVTIAHEKLPTFEHVEEWKFYWSDWLDAIAQG